MVVNQTTAYISMTNSSMIRAAGEMYQATPIGQFFWPILLMFTLVVVYIKTESPAAVFISSIILIPMLGALLPTLAHFMFYIAVVFALAMNLWAIFGSSKTD